MKKIIILGLLLIPSFSFAVNYVELPGTYEDLGGNNCTINSDLSFDCSNTNNVIVGTDSAWLKSSSSYFRTNSGLAMYIHFQNGNDFQGYITSFAICGSRDFPNCNSQMSYQDFLTYASNYELTNWEWYASQSSPGFAGPVFIFGDTYIYYVPHTTSNGQLVGQYGSYTPYDFGLSGWGLSANYSMATISPFQEEQPTYQEYSCPTIGQLLKTYGEEYNTGLCYSSNIIYSGGTIQTVTPKSIFELYPTRINLNQDIQNYNTYCNNVATQQACQTIFESKEEQYTLITKIPQEVQPLKLYQYCNLSLNYEPNQTTCTVTGAINTNTGITINDVIKEIGEGDITVVTPGKPPQNGTGINGTGSVYDGLLGDTEDDIKRRNVVKNAKDIIKTMKELYAKMTGIFRGRSGKNGMIPTYITGLILLIVLFKLFKK